MNTGRWRLCITEFHCWPNHLLNTILVVRWRDIQLLQLAGNRVAFSELCVFVFNAGECYENGG